MRVFIYRKNYLSLWQICKIYFYRILRYELLVWGEDSYKFCYTKSMKYPLSKECSLIQKKARRLLHNFFNNNKHFYNLDSFTLDYFRKKYDIEITDYYAFEKSITQYGSDKCITISPRFYESIIFKKNQNCFLPHFFIAFLFFNKSLIKLGADIYLNLITRKKLDVPPIIFLRKKVYPDMGEFKEISNKLNISDDKLICGVFPFSSRINEKFGFYFYNKLNISVLSILKAFLLATYYNFRIMSKLSYSGIDTKTFKLFWNDNIRAHQITLLNPNIIFGQLLDKPIYNLIYRNKNKKTLMISINESFRYEPNRNFDYVNLDLYYSMNSIDEKSLNYFGGNIKEFKTIPFFRYGKPTKLSKDIKDVIGRFDRRILVSTGQVFTGKSGYNFWSDKDLIEFIKECIKIINRNSNILFIFKEKKGEYSVLPITLLDELHALSNVVIISSVKPRDTKTNNFEALMMNVDLVISSTHISTVIWQTIEVGKAVIAVNDVHPNTFLIKYEKLETKLHELENTVNFWLRQPTENVNILHEKIKNEVNIGSRNGIDQICQDLTNRLRIHI